MNTHKTELTISISLPKPLDEPMKRYDERHPVDASIINVLNELIERQNALIEIVKKLAMK